MNKKTEKITEKQYKISLKNKQETEKYIASKFTKKVCENLKQLTLKVDLNTCETIVGKNKALDLFMFINSQEYNFYKYNCKIVNDYKKQ